MTSCATCPSGEYWDGQACATCPSGEYWDGQACATGGSTSTQYGDCECLCGNGNSFNPPVFPNQAGPDPRSVTESECTSQGTVLCKEMWTMMVENSPYVPPCSSGTVDEVYTAWIEDTSP